MKFKKPKNRVGSVAGAESGPRRALSSRIGLAQLPSRPGGAAALAAGPSHHHLNLEQRGLPPRSRPHPHRDTEPGTRLSSEGNRGWGASPLRCLPGGDGSVISTKVLGRWSRVGNGYGFINRNDTDGDTEVP